MKSVLPTTSSRLSRLPAWRPGGLLLTRPASGGGVTVNSGGSLQLQLFPPNNSSPVLKALTLNGIGFNGFGALQSFGGASVAATWAGAIALQSTTALGADAGSQLLISSAYKNDSETLELLAADVMPAFAG